jgi:hypothetical protein
MRILPKIAAKKKPQIFATFFFDYPFLLKKLPIANKITSAIPNDPDLGQTIFIRIGGRNPKCHTLLL